jgi:hypothetical protein
VNILWNRSNRKKSLEDSYKFLAGINPKSPLKLNHLETFKPQKGHILIAISGAILGE